MASGSGIGIVRIPPPDDEQDASEKAIRNIANLSIETYDSVIIFDDISVKHQSITVDPVQKSDSDSVLLSIFFNLYFQIKLSKSIIDHRDDLDTTFWHIGGYRLIFPMIVSKSTGHDIIIAVTGKPTKGFKNESSWGRWGKLLAFLSYFFERTAYRIADRIVVFSEAMVEYNLLEDFEYKTHKLRFNYESIPDSPSPITDRDNVIVFLGRIIELKGADKLAKAIEILMKKESCSIDRVLFIGDGNIRADLESKLNSNPQTSDVIEFTGWVSRKRAMEILEDAKIFALPSKSEGLPKALQEAMARGVIPVVSPAGSIPDIIQDHENGVLLADDNPETIAAAIEEVLAAEQSLYSKKAIQTIESEFSKEEILKRFKAVVRFQEENC
ncbi:glycosyltransferase family 4 protein [Halobaculum roseum]|uniref:Glycosyltransferase family 4 protein n=1 Tax=Halobaculum roseum TaxID=2175149 RepID=A0ABD5MK96_9EURY|nr:glycosyltransferase family 4 protein [Halobaculum roseum]QZY03245.1 glycosyltransferase family 4 protein [Halobaculum roseum]